MENKNLSLKDYARIYATIHFSIGMSDKHNIMTSDIVTTVLTQYHVSKGLKVYGEKGIEAVLSELKHLRDRMVIEPQHPEKMT